MASSQMMGPQAIEQEPLATLSKQPSSTSKAGESPLGFVLDSDGAPKPQTLKKGSLSLLD